VCHESEVRATAEPSLINCGNTSLISAPNAIITHKHTRCHTLKLSKLMRGEPPLIKNRIKYIMSCMTTKIEKLYDDCPLLSRDEK
jgi:hypothetical protein